MQCAFDQIIDDEDQSEKCEQWDSKNKYDAVGIDNTLSKLTLIYVDFRNAVEYYKNKIMEGSVRPPC